MPPQPIPSVFRQPRSDFAFSSSHRPLSLSELSDLATSGANQSSLAIESTIPITRYLIGSETLAKQAESYLQQGNLDEAFISLVKNCKLLIEILPIQHPGYKRLDEKTKKKLKEKGQWNLDQLSQVKVKVVDRFEAWRRLNPDVPLNVIAKKDVELKREQLRPMPSTGMMETRPSSSSSNNHTAPTIDYVKPDRSSSHLGFDVRDILGHDRRSLALNRSHRNAAPIASSPFTSSPLQPFTHSHSRPGSSADLAPAILYPSLRPTKSIRMNSHQISQGFAPRSEQTYSYYQIQSPFSSNTAAGGPGGPSFPVPSTSIAFPVQSVRPLPMPMPSHSQPSMNIQYPDISQSHTQRNNLAPPTVEQEAIRLLQMGSNDQHARSKMTIRGSTTEGGEHLRSLIIPSTLISRFVSIAEMNTKANVETCGLLMGTIDADMLQVNHLLIPKQTGGSDRCDTEDEAGIWEFLESKNLLTLGWCHTHPRQ